jgi:hypothetical protein
MRDPEKTTHLDLDHLLDAIQDEEMLRAVGASLEHADVPGSQPATVVKGSLGRFLVAEIPLEESG